MWFCHAICTPNSTVYGTRLSLKWEFYAYMVLVKKKKNCSVPLGVLQGSIGEVAFQLNNICFTQVPQGVEWNF